MESNKATHTGDGKTVSPVVLPAEEAGLRVDSPIVDGNGAVFPQDQTRFRALAKHINQEGRNRRPDYCSK